MGAPLNARVQRICAGIEEKRDRLLRSLCSSFARAPAPKHAAHSQSIELTGSGRAGPMLPAGYDAMDMDQLALQAKKLQAVVARRKANPGSCGSRDLTDSIVDHYEKLIAGLEQQMLLLQGRRGAGGCVPAARPIA
uniref:Uncharacterized protein n=1 Tax=Zooxanthella nutricula TaxID=1333877 RepID=A0A7S2P0V0_9DINO